MAAPKTTIWNIEPHTKAKHAILRRYLQAWLPILGMNSFPQIVYIDGFAGPGRYSQGEPGSPIIAIDAALEQQARIKANITFLFVEKDPARASVLQSIVEEMDTPPGFRPIVLEGWTFSEAMEEVYARLSKIHPSLPTFAFIDPFGWSGAPFDAVCSILRNPSCEVLVTFMYEEINRFIGHPDQEKNFDSFFGTNEWRQIVSIADPRERNRQLHDLYMTQLRDSANAEYVRSFEMRNDRDVTDYYLFYATNNILGLKKMKEAMWKVDSSGDFKFSDATDPRQSVFLINEPQLEHLQEQIIERFAGTERSIHQIEEFVVTETAFRETHYKRLLKSMEYADPPGFELVNAPPTRKRGTYGSPSLRLRFAPKQGQAHLP